MGNKKVLILLEGINFGGQQLMILHLIEESNKHGYQTEYHIGYFFDESKELQADFERNSVSLSKFDFPSRSLKKIIGRPIKLLRTIIEINKFIKKKGIDVIISNGFYTFFCSSTLRLVNKNIQHIRIVGGDLNRNEAFHFNSIFYYIFPLYKFTDKFISGEFIIDQLRKKGVDISKLYYQLDLTNLVDSNVFKPISYADSNKLRDELKIHDQVVIGWVGRLATDKEIYNTIKLLSIMKADGFENFKFLIVGDGDSKSEVVLKLKEKNIFDNTIFVGAIPQKELVKYYNIIDFEILLDKDPMGGSHIREAMACGRVVITTNGKSKVQEKLITNNYNGFLVSPNNMYYETYDIIKKLSRNRDLYNSVSYNARKTSLKNLSFKNASKKLENLIKGK